MSQKYRGHLDNWIETGSEGVVWSFIEDGEKGREATHAIEAGDHLIIYGDDGRVIFNGKIVPDDKAGWTEYPLNPGHGQPTAFGLWIHWTQKGWKPDDWAMLFLRHNFFDESKPPLRAVLIKKPSRKKPR